MLHCKDNPKGIDLYIKRFQSELYRRIANLCKGINHESYGRCNRSQVNGKYHAEVYNKSGEYVDVLWDDKSDMVSFFGSDKIILNETRDAVKIHLVVFCKPGTMKPDADEFADEEVRTDFKSIIGMALYGFHFKNIELGIENVLREYKGSAEKMKSIDQHPVHCFRINFTLHYNKNFSLISKLN